MSLLPLPAADDAPVALTDLDYATVVMCGCAPDDVDAPDRVCLTCGRPNLAALLAWSDARCDCGPDAVLELHGLPARFCARCGRHSHEALLRGPA